MHEWRGRRKGRKEGGREGGWEDPKVKEGWVEGRKGGGGGASLQAAGTAPLPGRPRPAASPEPSLPRLPSPLFLHHRASPRHALARQ